MQTTIEIPREFKRLFDTDWREAALYGGRFSLKSHTVARLLLIRARQKKTRVACFREFQNSITESSHQLLSDLIRQYGLADFQVTNNSIINTKNGSDFLFKGLWHNEQSIKSIEGIDIAWIEEAQTVTNQSLEVLTPTVRKEGSQIIYTYNRLMEDDPVHQRLVVEGRPNTLVLNVNYDIALKYGWMPEVIKLEMEDDREKRPALYRHKWLGEPYTSELRILKDWQIIESVPFEARLERHCVDFGFTNDETGIVDIYYYDGGYIWDEILYRKGVETKQIADTLLNLNPALTVGDSAEPRTLKEVYNYGVNIVGVSKTRGETKDETFVKWSFGILKTEKISMTRRSMNLIKEYNNLIWATDREGKILNIEDTSCKNHLISAGRYGMVSLVPMIRRSDRLKEIAQNPPRKHVNIAL